MATAESSQKHGRTYNDPTESNLPLPTLVRTAVAQIAIEGKE